VIAPLPAAWHGSPGGGAVVLANSLGARQGSWREVIERIGDRAHVLTFDLPGHARAEPAPFGFDDMAGAVVALLEERGVRDAVLCGVSLGGALAVAVAARRPDLVRGLVTVNAPLRQGSPGFWRERADRVETDGLDALADDLPSRWFGPGADPARVAELVAEFRALPPTGYAQACRAIADLDLERDARAVASPAVVVSGTDDVAVSPAQAEEYARLLPRAEAVVVPGAAHLLPVERPDVVADAILSLPVGMR